MERGKYNDTGVKELYNTNPRRVVILKVKETTMGYMAMIMKCVLIFTYGVSLFGNALGWTYNFSSTPMTWFEARQWCQNHYTDLVTIKNTDEKNYLRDNLPNNTYYYWIGLRWIDNTWTWVGTNHSHPNETFWAKNEPNDIVGNNKCVELYTYPNSQPGTWNDENCEKKKNALCYKTQCNNTCSGRGECTDIINHYSCECLPGFTGQQCEKAVNCSIPKRPEHGKLSCSGPHGNHSFSSTCTFSCSEGFQISGSNNITCNSSGEWNAQEPNCTVVECKNPARPNGGDIDCSGQIHSWKSTCWINFVLPVCGAVILSVSCCMLVCLMHRRKRKKLVQLRKEVHGEDEEEG